MPFHGLSLCAAVVSVSGTAAGLLLCLHHKQNDLSSEEVRHAVWPDDIWAPPLLLVTEPCSIQSHNLAMCRNEFSEDKTVRVLHPGPTEVRAEHCAVGVQPQGRILNLCVAACSSPDR